MRRTEGETPEDYQVEVAHEALVRNWPRLVEWLDEERASIRQRLRLTSAAEQWQNTNRDESALLRGELLREALAYDDLNDLETEFVKHSINAKRNRRLRLFGTIAGGLTIVGGLSFLAISGALQTSAAKARTELAKQKALVAEATAILEQQ